MIDSVSLRALMIKTFIALLVLAYLSGSIPTGKIIGHFHGIDIQKKGSGNIGFANAWRVLGWRVAWIVLTVDVLKGYLPVLVATRYLSGTMLLVVGLAAILGHIFTIWLNFKGGKGVATGFGVMLALEPSVAITGLAVYGLVITLARQSALASLSAIWSMPIVAVVLDKHIVIYLLLLALLGTWTHRNNIRQMLGAKPS